MIFPWEFSFCLFTSYAFICTCIRRHLKETILWSSITGSEMGKQNVQAEKVYSVNRTRPQLFNEIHRALSSRHKVSYKELKQNDVDESENSIWTFHFACIQLFYDYSPVVLRAKRCIPCILELNLHERFQCRWKVLEVVRRSLRPHNGKTGHLTQLNGCEIWKGKRKTNAFYCLICAFVTLWYL